MAEEVAEQAAATPPAAGAPAPTPPVYADATFKDTWTVELGGENVHVRYFGPGHTSGDAVIFFEKANVMHAGDLLFRRVHPRVDSPAGASVVNWLDILQKMSGAHGGDTAFIFGHGKDGVVLGNVADVKYSPTTCQRPSILCARASRRDSEGRDRQGNRVKGFEDVAQINPRIALSGVLESAYDELSKK